MLEQLEQAWRSENHGKKGNLEQEIEMTLSALEHERKRIRVILTICGAYTLITLVVSAVLISTRDIALQEAWPAAAAQGIAVAVLAYVARSRFARAPKQVRSVRENAALALRQTEGRIQTMKLVAGAMAVMLALVALAVAMLGGSGKMDARAMSSFASVCAVVVVFNAAVMWVKWTRHLRPNRQRLLNILRDLDRS